MYKGLVIEINEQYAIVLTNEMSYMKIIAKSSMKEGQQIYFCKEDRYKKKTNIKYLAMVASIILLIVGMKYLGSNTTQTNLQIVKNPNAPNNYAVVLSIDINPSIEIELDDELKVQNIRYINEDAKVLIDGSELKNKYYTLAIKDILTKARTKGYLEDQSSVMISSAVSTEDINSNTINNNIDSSKQTIKTKINQTIENQIENIFENEEGIKLVWIESDIDSLNQSRNLKLSLGKYTLFEKLKENNDNNFIDNRNIKKMKIAELVNEGIIEEANIDIKIPSEKLDGSMSIEIPVKDQFIDQNGTEYMHIDKLKEMNFQLKLNKEENSIQIKRNNETKNLKNSNLFLEKDKENYVLLKETLDLFNISYQYKGCDMYIVDGNTNIQLYYGNPQGQPGIKKQITRKIPLIEIPKIANDEIEKLQPKMIVVNGFELIQKSFLENQGFQLTQTKERQIEIIYKNEETIVDISFKQEFGNQIYYPLKEILDLFEIKYGYSENNDKFEIWIEDKLIEIKYKIIH